MSQNKELNVFSNIVELKLADKIKDIEEQIRACKSMIAQLKTQKEILIDKKKEYRYKANQLGQQIKSLIEQNNLADVIGEYKKVIIVNKSGELVVKVILNKLDNNKEVSNTF